MKRVHFTEFILSYVCCSTITIDSGARLLAVNHWILWCVFARVCTLICGINSNGTDVEEKRKEVKTCFYMPMHEV